MTSMARFKTSETLLAEWVATENLHPQVSAAELLIRRVALAYEIYEAEIREGKS